jgi:hypothetical protein
MDGSMAGSRFRLKAVELPPSARHLAQDGRRSGRDDDHRDPAKSPHLTRPAAPTGLIGYETFGDLVWG